MPVRNSPSGPVVIENVAVTFDFASVASVTAPDQAVTVAQARVGDAIICTPLGVWPAGLSIGPCRCLVAGTVQVRLCNPTAGAVDPASQSVLFTLIRPDAGS